VTIRAFSAGRRHRSSFRSIADADETGDLNLRGFYIKPAILRRKSAVGSLMDILLERPKYSEERPEAPP
jgi:hypothetical protein